MGAFVDRVAAGGAWPGRENYQEAARLLTRVKQLHETLGTPEEWTTYVAGLRERTRTLRALKEELAAAGL